MPTAMKPQRVSRLIELIRHLHSDRGHNVGSLARTCGVSRRTIFRDLGLLRQSGLSIEFDEERQQYGIGKLRARLRPAEYSKEETLSLLVFCRRFGNGSARCGRRTAARVR